MNTEYCENPGIRWALLIAAIIAAAITLMPELVLATTPTEDDTGFGAVAWQIYDNLDGAMGMVIGLTGVGLALVSMVRSITGPMAASGAGIAIGSQVAPDLAVTLNGGWLII